MSRERQTLASWPVLVLAAMRRERLFTSWPVLVLVACAEDEDSPLAASARRRRLLQSEHVSLRQVAVATHVREVPPGQG